MSTSPAVVPPLVVLVQDSERGRVHRCPALVPVLVGRDKDGCRIALKGGKVSRRHCELYALADGRLRVRDLGSTHGTFLGPVPLRGEGQVGTGDRVGVGPESGLTVVGVLDPRLPSRDGEGGLSLPREVPPSYLLLRGIGRGAAGLVYEAYDEERRERCALKVLWAGGPAGPELVARFKREALLQASLGAYPGIVRVTGFGTIPDSGELFFSMEYVAGTTLYQRLKDAPLPLSDGVHLMARVARAVHYAHEHGIVHRDIKPANVMLSEGGAIRLTDFGVCKALEDHDGLTSTGVMLGTPNYMAPEQIDDSKRVGPAADVYGLGAVLYVVLTRHLPFSGDSVPEILERVQAGSLLPPSQLEPTLPPALERICLRALALDPAARHPSAMDLAKDLEGWLKGRDPPTRVKLAPPDRPTRRPDGH